ncbi:hypothetical protein HWD29_gp179 [Klebsiella phage KpS8]|jgi:hypothetical protein|uniref:Uncharacterized protein n=2 Tax=Mydovirus KpS8 TaxID=2723896 RepID=A0A7L8ZIJ8_9CAUD|nr:hypothetical protein HWD29_gp179 [Klebsiella phage KpS8]QIW88335.1 hypothetical protein kps8_163 [Klebsiella phage KpS8]QOI68735.1 hypothetical protein phage621_00182 [Klebsiella phage vB_KpnM_Seu621]
MRQLEFMGRMVELISEWQSEYKMHRNLSEEHENWPDTRDQEDWMEDFFVWLQCKGYTV